jgi:hypothetical protein
MAMEVILLNPWGYLAEVEAEIEEEEAYRERGHWNDEQDENVSIEEAHVLKKVF